MIIPKPLRMDFQSGAPVAWTGDLSMDGSGDDLGTEGYELTVDGKGVEVRAKPGPGLFYAMQTIQQLKDAQDRLPRCYILDRPRFPYRGIMLDSCRHMQSVPYIKSLLGRMAELKFNRFHWHLTEDQGWRIEIEKYPELTRTGAYRTNPDGKRYGGFYTHNDIKDVLAYAEERFITVIPEIEMPGHSKAALASYPWLGCTGGPYDVRNTWGIEEDVYCAGKQSTYDFCQDVLTEVMQLFPNSPVIHIGGDECPKNRWKACPNCQAMIKKHGLADERELQGYFTSRIAHFLADQGRRLQGWDEILEGTTLPKGVIVQQWADPHAAIVAARQGLDVVCSPTSHCYLDYPYDRTPTAKVLTYEPIPAALEPQHHTHILGTQGNLWTEHMDTDQDVDRMAFPRALALAEVAWSGTGEKSWDDFKGRALRWIARQPADQHEALRKGLGT